MVFYARDACNNESVKTTMHMCLLINGCMDASFECSVNKKIEDLMRIVKEVNPYHHWGFFH